MNKDQMLVSLLSEFVGTFVIILGYAYFNTLPIILTLIVLAKTVTLGHLNPAVTIWYYVSGKMDITKAALYILAQCLAPVLFVILKTDL